jgi:hypothetical protein
VVVEGLPEFGSREFKGADYGAAGVKRREETC